MDDDDGFLYYEETTVDPGQSLLVATIVFGVLLNAFLPCLVSLANRYEKRETVEEDSTANEAEYESQSKSELPPPSVSSTSSLPKLTFPSLLAVDSAPSDSASASSRGSRSSTDSRRPKKENTPADDPLALGSSSLHKSNGTNSSDDASFYSSHSRESDRRPPPSLNISADSKFCHASDGSRTPTKGGRTSLDVGLEDERPPPTSLSGDGLLKTCRDIYGFSGRTPAALPPLNGAALASDHDNDSETYSDISYSTAASTSILDIDLTRRIRSRRRKRRAMKKRSDVVFDRVRVEHAVEKEEAVHQQAKFEHLIGDPGYVRKIRYESSVTSSQRSLRRGLDADGASNLSVLGRLSADEVSFNDAIDSGGRGAGHRASVETLPNDEDGVELCCGKHAWWRLSSMAMYFDHFLDLAEMDREMKRIIKLAIPLSSQAFLEGVFDTASVAVVGRLLGTREVSAYVVVDLLLGLTDEMLLGFPECLSTLASQAIGAQSRTLCGKYVQVSVLLHMVFCVPNLIFWVFMADDAIIWFGFDEETAKIGQDYALVLLFHQFIHGSNEALHALLVVTDHEYFSTLVSALEGLTGLVGIIIYALYSSAPSLPMIGVIRLFVDSVFFLLTSACAYGKGWLDPYLRGITSTDAITDTKIVCLVFSTAMPIAFGYLLQYGEWEVLTIFAGHLGPAEVVTWGIVGYIWEAFELFTEGIGDAGEVRCAFHLGAGNPAVAKRAAYKSILVSLVAAMLVTSCLYILGEDLGVWFTSDPTLQRQIVEVLPLVGVGNIVLTAGSVSWSLVGSQGRYRLATAVAFAGSWFVTAPLAALFTYTLNINLQGLAAAIVIGYLVSGAANTFILLRSDWNFLSKKVIEDNAESDSESESSSED